MKVHLHAPSANIFWTAGRISILIIFFGIVVGAVVATPFYAGAQTTDVSGWAWAANFGWIRFSGIAQDGAGMPYGVSIDETTGDVSGYAWSGSKDVLNNRVGLGWLSFERGTAGDPPSDDIGAGAGPITRLNTSTNRLEGWARFLSYGNGWDGWVKLSGTAMSGNAYGARLAGQDFFGWAWGSETVGWISFNNLNCDQPTPPPGCPPSGTTIARYFVTTSGASGGSVDVRLVAAPSRGKTPVNDVDLTAIVSNATGDVTYEFYCIEGGPISHTEGPTASLAVTVPDLCDYATGIGIQNALVVITDSVGNTAFDTAQITILGPFGEIRPD